MAKKANSNLAEAKKNKNDEFYTQWSDIEKEIMHYRDHFRDKVVYMNCDDPEESNFWKIFAQLFNEFGLMGLISTHYDPEKPTYMLELTRDNVNDYINEDGTVNHGVLVRHPLEGNGDFRNAECIELLRRSDIVVTNPPFSLFREYVAQLMEYEKKFLIIGNQNAISNKDIFPLFKNNQLWFGISISSGDREFRVPDSYPLEAAGSRVDEQGNKYIRVKGVRWFTNLTHRKRTYMLPLYAKQSEKNFPKYDNYDAINIDKVVDIPFDYRGVMGVPITFIDKFNPDQFEIITLVAGNTRVNAGPDVLTLIGYSKNSNDRGGCGLINNNRLYSRILIRHRLTYDEHGIVIGRRE